MSALFRRDGQISIKSGQAMLVGAGYSVTAYPIGAQVVSGSGTTITVRAGHGMAVGDKIMRSDGTMFSGSATVSSVTSTSIVMSSGSWSGVALGDILFNLGPDTGTASPNYNGSPIKLYADMAGATTALTNATVTSGADGQYGWWTKAAGAWELIRTPAGAIADYQANLPSGELNPCDYGAAGDGTADDTKRIQTAAVHNLPMVFPQTAGYYKITDTIVVGASVCGEGMAEIRMVGTAGGSGTYNLAAHTTEAYPNFVVYSASDTPIEISGLTITGTWDESATSGEYSHNIDIRSSNVWVRNCYLKNAYGDNVFIAHPYNLGSTTGPTNIRITDNILEDPRRCNVAPVNCQGVVIDGNKIAKVGVYVGSIDIEPDAATSIAKDISITNNDVNVAASFVVFNNAAAAGALTRVRVAHNRVQASYMILGTAAASYSSTNITISHNTHYGTNGVGYVANLTAKDTDVIVAHNEALASGTGNNSLVATKTVRLRVTDNLFSNATVSPVVLDECGGAVFARNTVIKTVAANDTLRLQSTSTTAWSNVIIASNNFTGATNGILITGAAITKLIVTGNSIGAATNGINIESTANGTDLLLDASNTFTATTPITGSAYLLYARDPRVLQASGHTFTWAAAAPSGGTWLPGDIVWRMPGSTGEAGKNAGWFCITDGTPGIWKQFGVIDSQEVVSLTPGSITAGTTYTSAEVAIGGGCAFGDFVIVGCPSDPAALVVSGQVSSANNVKIRIANTTAGNLTAPSGNYRVKVIRQ